MRTIFGILVMALGLTVAAKAEWEFPADYKTEPTGITEVIIDCPQGAIRFEPSTDGNISIHVLRIFHDEKKEKAENLAKEHKVEFHKEGHTLVATIEASPFEYQFRGAFNKLFSGNSDRGLEILVRVSVPSNLSLSVKTSSADVFANDLKNDLSVKGSSSDIKIENIVGNCDFRVSSGDIEAYTIDGKVSLSGSSSDIHADDIKGDLEVVTSSGDGIIRRVKGKIKIETTSGDLRISDIDGNADLETTSGDIVGEYFSDGVQAQSSSGDIKLNGLNETQGIYHIETVSGDISLEVAHDFNGRVEAETSSGNINSSIITTTAYSDSHYSGKTGDGSGNIHVVTTSGDINLERM